MIEFNNLLKELKKQGDTVKASKIKNRYNEIMAARKKKLEDNGDSISTEIISKIKEDLSEILNEKGLSTALFYIEKAIGESLKNLKIDLNNSIQEVMNTNSK